MHFLSDPGFFYCRTNIDTARHTRSFAMSGMQIERCSLHFLADVPLWKTSQSIGVVLPVIIFQLTEQRAKPNWKTIGNASINIFNSLVGQK